MMRTAKGSDNSRQVGVTKITPEIANGKRDGAVRHDICDV